MNMFKANNKEKKGEKQNVRKILNLDLACGFIRYRLPVNIVPHLPSLLSSTFPPPLSRCSHTYTYINILFSK